MEKSLFIKFIEKRYPVLVAKIVELVNGSKNPVRYYHKEMLVKAFSVTLKWNSLSSNGTIVAADVVALDSSLPLKKRDSISKADGDIPKLGMKLYLNERTMQELQILQALPGQENEVLKKLFEDTPRVINGIYEQLELMFLQGLSSGVALVNDEDRPGVGIRIDYGHPAANKFGVNKNWDAAEALPLDDIDNVISRAKDNGDSPAIMMMDKATWNAFRKNAQVKQLYGAYLDFAGANIPTPSLSKINEALSDNSYPTIEVVDRRVVVETNGIRKAVNPWEAGKIVFLNTLQVGTLTYGRLAEENFPVAGVTYTKADDFILVSKYGKNDPVREFTSSQGLVVPVIDGVSSIYIMDAFEASEDTQTEGDANFDYSGTSYTRASVIAGINKADDTAKAAATNKDATLQKKINALSDEQITVFETELIEA